MTRTDEIQPVILCGGRGTRLWPISTDRAPKPFLPLISDKSMLAETAARVSRAAQQVTFGPLCAVGSARHEDLLRRELPGAGLILEPVPRNSAPAVAAACLGRTPGDLVLIMPADHHVSDLAAFHRALTCGAKAARSGAIVTFGIKPDHAATCYGYIRAPGARLEQAASVQAFVEKPSRETAQDYLEQGGYWWNAGIFLFSAGRMLEAFAQHAPDILEAVTAAAAISLPPRPGQSVSLDAARFAECRSESIDYAVMEHVEGVEVVPVDMGWSDIGDYGALHALKSHRHDNVCEGAVFAIDTHGCYVRSEGPMIAVRGLSGIAVAATPRGVLVTPLSEAASTKPLAEEAARRGFAASLQSDTIARLRNWLFEDCLPFWAERAWDEQRGGFVEAIDLDGAPLAGLDRRGRVLPRQIYAFSHARLLGWDDPRGLDLVHKGLDYLDTTARAPQGGWASVLTPQGEPVSAVRALYDHAFVMLAGAYAFMATGETRAREIAEEALAFVQTELADPEHGGFLDRLPHGKWRHSNPHMHLLEAALALRRATGEARFTEFARDIVELFETRFFDPKSGALTETFAQDWSRAPGAPGNLVEPGHCYEWAVLLGFFEEETGRDLISWRRRLIAFADRIGRNAEGFALDAVDRDAKIVSGKRRLWPQLEMFRARLFHPETAPPGEASRVLDRILASYLAGGPRGGWIDAFDAKGQPAAPAIPASMLYHMLTAFDPLFGFDLAAR
ncbi:hypothetical protein E5163_04110 [Marinicauda algicola]|uniref:Nucleotidyl transferase domain-containing protein n=1 Tax=Marinicauda algicola TaxID=2029849 RepID=A0A4S2H4H7_9PROT|nr:AGE family epimerase/isomerase [Marinicauda algicola]TGY90318.1 hypothetical protein E5163_04110 [Marinicauda algicola]